MTLRKVCICAFALTSILTFTGCQTAPTTEPKRDVATDMPAINALRGQFDAAYNSNDAAALAARYADDAIVMPPDQAATEGRPAIQARLEAYFNENTAKIARTELETQVGGNWAYARGNLTVTVTPKSGKPTEESIKHLAILKRQPDGSWKVYRDINNSNNPPPTAAGRKK